MRITAVCCCGADFVCDDGGQNDACTRKQLDELYAKWQAVHEKCPAVQLLTLEADVENWKRRYNEIGIHVPNFVPVE